MKTTWQGLPKQPRAVFRKMKIEQEKGEIIGTLPGARFTHRSLPARQGLAGGGVGGLIATNKPINQ